MIILYTGRYILVRNLIISHNHHILKQFSAMHVHTKYINTRLSLTASEYFFSDKINSF